MLVVLVLVYKDSHMMLLLVLVLTNKLLFS